MQYTIRAGILYGGDPETAIIRMKSALNGPIKKVYGAAGGLLLQSGIRHIDVPGADRGDLRSREYTLTDSNGSLIGSARPGYADGEDPGAPGWPICKMPRVDHADMTLCGSGYRLCMQDERHYALTDAGGREVLNISHRGICGGWTLSDAAGFAPEILCGIFAFCRYIEWENEFLIV